MKTSKELRVKRCEKRGCEAKTCKVSRCHSMLERKGGKVATGGERTMRACLGSQCLYSRIGQRERDLRRREGGGETTRPEADVAKTFFF